MRPDAIVVGAGLAGLSAAVRLAEGGARVLVLAKGVGATHLSAGTIDVLGYAGGRVERPLDALDNLPDGHPYALVGADGVAAAVDWFKRCFEAGPLAPYSYAGRVEENLLLPTAVGAIRPSAVVPETMARGDLRDGARVCTVGFRALKDFHPALLADNLARAPEGTQGRWPSRARSTIPPSGPRSQRMSPAACLPRSGSGCRRCWASPARTRCGPSSSTGSAGPSSRSRPCRRRFPG
jgi:glycerol-3-phosphate dehydrogenase subunit B